MIYGYKFMPDVDTSTISESMFGFNSVAYNEYYNRQTLLESIIDENERIRLEAQIEVLQEVSVKDIWEKIKEIWNKILEFIKK